MSGRLFNRAVALTVARVRKDRFFETTDQITVTDLRVAFSIERHLGAEPNTANVTVYNLAKESRALFEGKPLQVRLDAGFDGQVKTLFTGDLTYGYSSRPGTEWETKLQLGDGHRAYNHARVNRSFPAGTSALDIAKDIAGKFLTSGGFPKSAEGIAELSRQTGAGSVASGAARREFTRVLREHGCSWSIQDGKLQVLELDKALANEALIISQETGMLGSPEFGPPKKKGGKRVMKVNVLLYPEIAPGRKISVTSLAVNGLFKVERVTHEGDTAGADWMTTIEAVPV